MSETQTKVASLIARRHPHYADYMPSWTFYIESYLGGMPYINRHLFQYFKEGDKEFAARKARAYRENHTKRVVDLINSYLFKEEAARRTENKYIGNFWKDFDGRGSSVNKFMKKASIYSSIFGRVYIVCDKKPLPPEERTGTQMDNLQKEAQPYCYLVYPQDMLDIAFDDYGKIRWALVLERKRDDEDPYEATGDVREQYRLWTQDSWTLFNDHGKEIDSGETNLSRVPIVILDSEEQDQYTGLSLVSDVSYLDRAIMNNWSRLDVIVNDQTFSQLIFPVEGLPADIIDDEELRGKFLTLATNRILLYSAQAQAAPEYISPDASQATFILSMIDQQVRQLYASMGVQAENTTQINEASGASKAYDFDKLNKLLAGKADNCEEAEREILEIYKLWMGSISGEATVDYPDEFNTRSLMDEILIAQELTILAISETFTKELHKQIAAKVMPKLDQKTQDKIDKEIDERDLLEEEAMKQGIFPFDSAPGKQMQQMQREERESRLKEKSYQKKADQPAAKKAKLSQSAS